ncbi:MAG: WecB/TagA/CpsF family glycosyltransferase [Ignavibacteriales bacterium]|nr:WecB/TagA/CpsF family glycosyltransferase [Ignavibacteriales bacterium]
MSNLALIPHSARSGIPAIETVSVLGVSVGVLTRHRATALLRECVDRGVRGWITYVNIHALNLAFENPWFQLFLNNSLFAYCDGQGVRMGAAMGGKHLPERIVMSDWVYDVCELAVLRGLHVYLLGSSEFVINKAAANLKEWYPDLQIAGTHHGHLFDLDSESVAQAIGKLNVDLLIVGMGMPRQEQWILRHYDRLNARIILPAGSCFDYVAGVKKRCPAWMGVLGFEWLYRLAQEPRRLWRRYLLGNPRFLWRVLTGQ